MHCVRDCTLSKQIWGALGMTSMEFQQAHDFFTWQQRALDGSEGPRFVADLWYAWCARNAKCIGGEDIPLQKILRDVKIMEQAIARGFRFQHHTERTARWVTWHQSREDVVVLNVDGSADGSLGRAGFGGLLRQGDGAWMLGFYGSLGATSSLLAVLFFGLQTAWDYGVRRLVCYSDSSMALKLVRSSVNFRHCYAAWIGGVTELLRRDWVVDLVHTLREGNRSADVLAKLKAS